MERQSARVERIKKQLLPEKWAEVRLQTELDLPCQRVIKADADRTRSNLLSVSERATLEQLLTIYCKLNSVPYKQGLNEVLAPFVLLMREGLTGEECYLCFQTFVGLYLKPFYVDKDFRLLRAQFFVLRLMLKYHDTRFSTFLAEANIGPELYSTPWFLTLFSSKIPDIDLLLSLWLEFTSSMDFLFTIYICLSLLFLNKTPILSSELSHMLVTLSQLTISTEEELYKLIQKAEELRAATPPSVELYFSSLRLDSIDSIDDKLSLLERKYCVSVLPSEILQVCYPSLTHINCQAGTCRFCQSASSRLNMLIIDCRTVEGQDMCTLPNTCLLEEAAYMDQEVMSEVPDRFMSIRGAYHVVLMGDGPFRSSSFNLDYIDPGDEEIDVVQNMMENLLLDFQQKGFCYVSVVEGGFVECHDLALKLNCELEKHSEMCVYCRKSEVGSPNRAEKLKKKVLGKVKNMFSGLKALAKKYTGKNEVEAPTTPPPVETEIPSIPDHRDYILKRELERWQRDEESVFYSCKKYDKVLGSCYPEDRILILTRREIIVSTPFQMTQEDSGSVVVSTVVESAPLSSLLKIASKKSNSKVLSFYFHVKGEDFGFSYGFQDTVEAKDCIQKTQGLVKVLKSGGGQE